MAKINTHVPPRQAAARLTFTWEEAKKRIEARITELRSQNDSPALDMMSTAALRGQIAMALEILGYENPVPAPGEQVYPAMMDTNFERRLD